MLVGDYVRTFGRHAPVYLRERQEAPLAQGDAVLAVTWWKIAEAVRRLLLQPN